MTTYQLRPSTPALHPGQVNGLAPREPVGAQAFCQFQLRQLLSYSISRSRLTRGQHLLQLLSADLPASQGALVRRQPGCGWPKYPALRNVAPDRLDERNEERHQLFHGRSPAACPVDAAASVIDPVRGYSRANAPSGELPGSLVIRPLEASRVSPRV